MTQRVPSIDASRWGGPSPDWAPDVLGDGYEQRVIPLGTDPDGEGEIVATLVRAQPSVPEKDLPAVLYVHGNTDYFFQRHLADYFTGRGHAFYAIDLRKCGRSRRPGQTPHYVTDLARYDAELNAALRIVRAETGQRVLLVAHSSGGLVAGLWLDRLHASGGNDIVAAVFNSPWLDLQGAPWRRTVGTRLIDVIGALRPRLTLPGAVIDTYGSSIHVSRHGEWDYDLSWKPLTGTPVKFGWLRAITRGQATLHRGLDIGVPALVLRSRRSATLTGYCAEADVADVVINVEHIQRWSGCFGDRTTIIPIDGARHDVFLSTEKPRTQAFDELSTWLDASLPGAGA